MYSKKHLLRYFPMVSFFIRLPHVYHQWFFHHDGQQRFTINFFGYVVVNFFLGLLIVFLLF